MSTQGHRRAAPVQLARFAVAAGLLAVSALAPGCLGTDDSRRDRSSPVAPPPTLWPADARYDLTLRYSERRHELAGREEVSFVNTSRGAINAVWLRAWPNAFGSCAQRYLRIRRVSGARVSRWRQRCTALRLRLDRPLRARRRAVVALAFAVRPPKRADRFGLSRGVAYFGNALPILAVSDAHGAHLPPYSFSGDSFFSLTARWRVDVKLPAGLQVASTGTERRTSARWLQLTAPRARDFALVIGSMRVTETEARGKRIRHFAVSSDRTQAKTALGAGAAALATFSRRFGPYTGEELDIVDAPGEIGRGAVAMEYPQLVLAPPSAPAVEHEVAHQWWYSQVGTDQFREPWLDEGLAEFSQASLPGPDRLGNCRVSTPRGTPPLRASLAAFKRFPREIYTRVAYLRAGCILRRLAARIGRARFDEVLRELAAERGGGVETGDSFAARLRRAAGSDRVARQILEPLER